MVRQPQSLVVDIIIIIIINAFAISTALRWTSFDTIPSGSSVRGCQEENIMLPWRYEAEESEHVIDVEWYFQGNTAESDRRALASYVMGNFLTSSSEYDKVSYLPNAGLVLHDVTGNQSGLYTVQINLSLHGSIVTDTQTVHVGIAESQCSDPEFEITSLRKQLNQLTADNDVLRQQNTNLLALYQQMLNASCTGSETPRNCVDILRQHRASGVYTVYLSGDSPLQVYCDHDTGGGGWTVIQWRQDGSVSFNRSWTEYEDGFGDLTGEFWLGLSHIHRLSADKAWSLQVDLTDWNGDTAYALYNNFYIDGADDKYRLHVGGYQGTAGNALNTSYLNHTLYLHDGMSFSTFDIDNDNGNEGNCASIYGSGWWYNNCFATSLNGMYRNDSGNAFDSRNEGVTWYDWHQDWRSYKYAEMKIKSY